MKEHWEKVLQRKLIGLGLTWDQARSVVGIIVEERQLADLQGYDRGFNDASQKKESK